MKKTVLIFSVYALMRGISTGASFSAGIPTNASNIPSLPRAYVESIKSSISEAPNLQGIPSALAATIRRLDPSKPEQQIALAPFSWFYLVGSEAARAPLAGADLEQIKFVAHSMQSIAAEQADRAERAAKTGDRETLLEALRDMDKILLYYPMYLPAKRSSDAPMDMPRFKTAHQELRQKLDQMESEDIAGAVRRTADALGTSAGDDSVHAENADASPKNELSRPKPLGRSELIAELEKRVESGMFFREGYFSTGQLRKLLKTIDQKSLSQLRIGFYFKKGDEYIFLSMPQTDRLRASHVYHQAHIDQLNKFLSDPVRQANIKRAEEFLDSWGGLRPKGGDNDRATSRGRISKSPKPDDQPYFPSLFGRQKPHKKKP